MRAAVISERRWFLDLSFFQLKRQVTRKDVHVVITRRRSVGFQTACKQMTSRKHVYMVIARGRSVRFQAACKQMTSRKDVHVVSS